jgi:hypothetical protein
VSEEITFQEAWPLLHSREPLQASSDGKFWADARVTPGESEIQYLAGGTAWRGMSLALAFKCKYRRGGEPHPLENEAGEPSNHVRMRYDYEFKIHESGPADWLFGVVSAGVENMIASGVCKGPVVLVQGSFNYSEVTPATLKRRATKARSKP